MTSLIKGVCERRWVGEERAQDGCDLNGEKDGERWRVSERCRGRRSKVQA